VLITYESSLGAFLLTILLQCILVITFAYHLFLGLAEYQPQVYSTLLFPPTVQNRCSEGEDGLEFIDKEF
jgi:hypothetical protein